MQILRKRKQNNNRSHMPPFEPHRSGSPASPVAGELLDADDRREPQLRPVNEQWAKLLSYWMDSAIEIPHLGWRFGLDPIIGLVPIAGDLATTLVSFYILSLAVQLRIPRSTMARMALNVGIDYVLGAIPLVGNVFDFAWKANQRNMQLLERAAAAPVHERRRQTILDWLMIGGVVVLLVAGFVGSIMLAVWLVTWFGKTVIRSG
jgi:uncharacterized protein DUF4112